MGKQKFKFKKEQTLENGKDVELRIIIVLTAMKKLSGI
jgi:hypothetical protein